MLFDNLTQNARPCWLRKYMMFSWKNICDAPNYNCYKTWRQAQNITWIMIYICGTDNKLTTLLCPQRKCSQLAITLESTLKKYFPKLWSFFLFTKEAIHFVGHFKLANGQQQFWPKLGAKGIAKHKAREYLGEMGTKRKIIHPSIWLFKAIYNYVPFMVVSIKSSPLRRQKTE